MKLRFTFEVEFDSTDTAKAYGVALGFALSNIETNALEISEAPAPRITRGKVEVSEAMPAARHG